MSAINVQIADKPYAVLELPVHDQFESNIYAVPACTAWLENITVQINAKDDKQATFAAICKWPPDECKLSDYLEKKKKPTDTWIVFKNVKILKFCKSVRQAKQEVEKALNISDLSQSDKEKSGKRQRFVTQRYTPPLNQTSRQKNYINVDDSDSDFESTTPVVRNLKIRANNNNIKTLQFSNEDSDGNFSDNYATQNVSCFSKFHEPQTSNATNLTYSSIDEIIKESLGPVVIEKNLQKKYKKDQVQKNLNTNNQGNEQSGKQRKDKASEHECENEAKK
ncbi:DUF4806 domain-containing protein [Camponotus japonicus]